MLTGVVPSIGRKGKPQLNKGRDGPSILFPSPCIKTFRLFLFNTYQSKYLLSDCDTKGPFSLLHDELSYFQCTGLLEFEVIFK